MDSLETRLAALETGLLTTNKATGDFATATTALALETEQCFQRCQAAIADLAGQLVLQNELILNLEKRLTILEDTHAKHRHQRFGGIIYPAWTDTASIPE